MKHYQTVFNQFLALVPRFQFQKYVNKYNGDKKSHKLNCWSQFVAILYSQLRERDSLRGITEGLDTQINQLYHLGVKPVKRSTFSDANNKRNMAIYEDLFNHLLARCKQLSQRTMTFENPIRSIDASVIDLCYGLYPWAKYRTRKGAIKLHVELSHQSYLPETVVITEGNVHEINIGRKMEIRPDSIYVVDRGYLDYEWLYKIHTKGAKFVIRAKKDTSYSVIGQHDTDADSGVISDEDIIIPWKHKVQKSLQPKYKDKLRLVTYFDEETGKTYRFITNIEDFKPETIALIYKQRWQIELFFKWIKQHLKIKSFIGTSKNAVMTQIWIAMITYLLLWYLKHQTKFQRSLLALTRIINETLFQKISFIDLLGLDHDKSNMAEFTQLALVGT